MTTLSHPFYKTVELPTLTKDEAEAVQELFDWMLGEPRFPNYTKHHALLFLHACFWKMESAKRALKKYGRIRAESPDIFDNRDPLSAGTQFVFSKTNFAALPKLTPEGYRLLCYRLTDYDLSKMVFGEAVKAFCMFNDFVISESGVDEGYIVLFDMKGIRLSHLGKLQFGPLRVFMQYIQEAHPVRLKKICVIHTASFINQVMALIKPLIRSELLGLLNFTTGGPEAFFDMDIMPEEYGGKCGSLVTISNQQRHKIENDYRDWLIDSGKLKEAPKDQPTTNNNTTATPKGSSASGSKKIEIEPPISRFMSLDID